MTENRLATMLWALTIATVLIVTLALAEGLAMAMAGEPAIDWRERLPATLLAWGLLGGVVTIGVARAAAEALPRGLPPAVLLLVMATVAGAAVELTLHRWASARFGGQAADPELIGWSSLLAPMVVLVGLMALAAVALPAPGRVAARAMTVVVSGGVLLIAASNLPGAFDGISPLGLPMGIAMAAAALAALGASVLALLPGRPAQP